MNTSNLAQGVTYWYTGGTVGAAVMFVMRTYSGHVFHCMEFPEFMELSSGEVNQYIEEYEEYED